MADPSASIAFLGRLRDLEIFCGLRANAVIFLKFWVPYVENVVLVIAFVFLAVGEVFF